MNSLDNQGSTRNQILKSRAGNQIQQEIDHCEQNIKKVQRIIQRKEEMKHQAKERLEEVISTTFSKLNETFEVFSATFKMNKEGRRIGEERKIVVPKIGEIDELQDSYRHPLNGIEIKLEKKRSQLDIEITELENSANEQKNLQEYELRDLNEEKRILERRRNALKSECKSKSQLLDEKMKAAEMERRYRERIIERQYYENLYQKQCEIEYLEKMARTQATRSRLGRFISNIEDDCRLEAQLRLVIAYQNGEISGRVNKADVDAFADQLVRRRIAKMLHAHQD